MKTSDELEKAFKHDLRELLNKYDAELEAADHYMGYPECGEDIRMTVTIPAIYIDGTCIREHTEIDFGRWIYPETYPEWMKENN